MIAALKLEVQGLRQTLLAMQKIMLASMPLPRVHHLLQEATEMATNEERRCTKWWREQTPPQDQRPGPLLTEGTSLNELLLTQHPMVG
jgi:hypothetical protein